MQFVSTNSKRTIIARFDEGEDLLKVLKEGASYGGHLMEGSIIYPFAEVIIQECDATIDRTFDKKTNLWPMKF